MLPWLRLLIGLATVTVATPVLADWRTQSGLDVASGKASVLLIGELDQRTTFYASCIGGEFSLKVQSYDGRDDAPDVGDVRLTIRTDSGAAWASDATYGRTISGYLDATYEAIGDIPAIVSDLVAASTTISVGLEFEEAGESVWDGSARGSTAAGRAFLDACGIAVPAASPARIPETASTVPTGVDWVVNARAESDGTTSYTLVGEASDGRGALLFACTSEGGIYLGFTAATEESPQRQSRAPMQLSVRLGDFTYDLEADVRASNETATTVLSDDTGMAYVIADVLSWGMVTEIAVTVRDPRTGAKLLRRGSVGNVGPAAADFKEKCAATAG